MKREEAADILAWHALSNLPDSVAARRQILSAVLAVCPGSRYADRISVMLEHLEQHAAIGSKFKPRTASSAVETHEE
jgi:hypothetical protein